MDILSQPVLVLNSGYFPISVRSVKDAICMVLTDKAAVLRSSEGNFIRSEKLRIPVPNVILVNSYHKVPYRKVKPNRSNIFARDNYTCVYCHKRPGVTKLTLDHVIPRSRWNELKHTVSFDFQSWENVVTACCSCNTKKGNLLLSELKWKQPEQQQKSSRIYQGLNINRKTSEQFGWDDFLFF
jgi:5-methylcytosine-specific restriction endonuclease McrA